MLQSMGLQRAGHDLGTEEQQQTFFNQSDESPAQRGSGGEHMKL